jgi:prepilin-type processing-associated H-X9-DG protein
MDSIVVPDGGNSLVMTDAGAEPRSLQAATLRMACRCAHCTRARIDGKFPAAFTGVTIDALTAMGHYGVNVAFSDGHARGIYPWSYLAELLDK